MFIQKPSIRPVQNVNMTNGQNMTNGKNMTNGQKISSRCFYF